MSKEITKKIFEAGIFIVSLILFIFVFFLIIPYIHETGHILFGSMDGLYKGEINKFTISNWRDYPLIPFIKTPREVRLINGRSSLNFAMGGPIFVIILFAGLSFFAYLRSRKKKWFFLFGGIFIFELSGNIICGTDNWTRTSLNVCNHSLDMFLQGLGVLLFAGVFSYFVVIKIKEVWGNNRFL